VSSLKILLSRDFFFPKVCYFIRVWPQCAWNLSLYREVKYHLAYICHKCSDQFQRKQQTYEWTNFSHFGYILWKIYPNAILKCDFFDKVALFLVYCRTTGQQRKTRWTRLNWFLTLLVAHVNKTGTMNWLSLRPVYST
jgi:hypothetical protein